MLADLIEEAYGAASCTSPLKKVREKAWKRYQEIGFPSKKHDAYAYLKLRELEALSFPGMPSQGKKPSPLCKGPTFLFENGQFQQALSKSGKVIAMPLEEAVKTYGLLLDNQWSASLKREKDPFAAINTALHPQGLFLYLPPNTILDDPIEIHHLSTTPSMLFPHIHVVAGKGAEATFLHTHSTVEGCLINGMTTYHLDENAKITQVNLQGEAPDTAYLFDATRATLKKDAKFSSYQFTEGARAARSDYRISLQGEGSSTDLNGIACLSEKKETHVNILIDHQAPHTSSRQFFKHVLKDFARSSFEGKIFVESEAQKTDAFQLNNNLLLSDSAQAYCKPNLEIFADDVKASHGATVGALDDEQLFYMQARGTSREEAKELLTKAFCLEIADKIPVALAKAYVLERI